MPNYSYTGHGSIADRLRENNPSSTKNTIYDILKEKVIALGLAEVSDFEGVRSIGGILAKFPGIMDAEWPEGE